MIRGGGCQTLVMGEKPKFCHLVDFPSSLVNLFNVLLGSWGVMAAGGWGSECLWEWGGRTVSPLPTCPLHPCFPFFSLTHSSLVSSLSPRFCFWILLTHRLGGGFGLRQTFSWLHELLSTHALKFRVLAVDCSSTDKNGAVFSSRRASIVVQSHAEGFFPRFSSRAQEFLGFSTLFFSQPKSWVLWLSKVGIFPFPLRGIYVFSPWFCCPRRAVFPTFAVSCAHWYILRLLFSHIVGCVAGVFLTSLGLW